MVRLVSAEQVLAGIVAYFFALVMVLIVFPQTIYYLLLRPVLKLCCSKDETIMKRFALNWDTKHAVTEDIHSYFRISTSVSMLFCLLSCVLSVVIMTQLLFAGTLNGNMSVVRWICFVTWLFSHYSINYTFVARLYISFKESVVQYANHIILMLGITLVALPSLLVISLLFHLFHDDQSALFFFILFIAVDLLFSIILTWLFVQKLYQLLRGRILSSSANRSNPMTALERREFSVSRQSRVASSRALSLKHRKGPDIIMKTAAQELPATGEVVEESHTADICTHTRTGTASAASTASTVIKVSSVAPSPEPAPVLQVSPESIESPNELQSSGASADESDYVSHLPDDDGIVIVMQELPMQELPMQELHAARSVSDVDVDVEPPGMFTRVRSDSSAGATIDPTAEHGDGDEKEERKRPSMLDEIDIPLDCDDDGSEDETPVPETPVPVAEIEPFGAHALTRINIRASATAQTQTTPRETPVAKMTPVRSRLFKQIELARINSVGENVTEEADEKDTVPELPTLPSLKRGVSDLEEMSRTASNGRRSTSRWNSISRSMSVLVSPQKNQSYKRAKEKLDEQQLYLINSMARHGLLLFVSSLTSLLCVVYILFTYSHFEDMGIDNASGDIGVEYRSAVAHYYLYFCIAVSSSLNAWSLFMSFVFASWMYGLCCNKVHKRFEVCCIIFIGKQLKLNNQSALCAS